MQELKTIADKISRVQATVYRKLRDLNVRQMGTKTEILRISATVPDDWGQTVEDLKDFILSSVYVKHPFASKVELFSTLDNVTQESDVSAIDVFSFLPYEIFVPMLGDHETEPVSLMKGDLIVEVMRSENDTKIPLILQVTRSYGQVTVFTICGRQYDCALYRGTLAPNIKAIVDLYCNSIE